MELVSAVLILPLIFGVAALVLIGLAFIKAWIRDLMGLKPTAINLEAVRQATAGARWPNLVWRRRLFREEMARFKKGISQLGAGTGRVIMWVIGLAILCGVIYFVAGLPIPVAIIIGAIIIALAISNRRH
jgi:hypothetical protein